MSQYYAIWCPLGDQCSKGNRQLAKFDDPSKCRAALYSHLSTSPYHSSLTPPEAQRIADEAEVQCWAWDGEKCVKVEEGETEEVEEEFVEEPTESPQEEEDEQAEPQPK